jgi:hypothetical protein
MAPFLNNNLAAKVRPCKTLPETDVSQKHNICPRICRANSYKNTHERGRLSSSEAFVPFDNQMYQVSFTAGGFAPLLTPKVGFSVLF